jgi:hypothetical protein
MDRRQLAITAMRALSASAVQRGQGWRDWASGCPKQASTLGGGGLSGTTEMSSFGAGFGMLLPAYGPNAASPSPLPQAGRPFGLARAYNRSKDQTTYPKPVSPTHVVTTH